MSRMTDQQYAWIQSYQSGNLWINKLGSPHTRRKFISYLKTYCDKVQKTPDELIALKVEGLRNVGTATEWQAEDLLENFFANCEMKSTAKLMLRNAVFSFYKHNRRSLESQTACNIKNETPESKKRKPTLEDLKALERVARLKRDKALLWFIASTSCRVGTVESLTWSDLIPTANEKVPYTLEIESKRLKGAGIGKYKGLKQVTFVHTYAWQLLEDYKNEASIRGYELTQDSPLFIRYWNKGQIKGLTAKGINAFFDNASLAAWNDLEQKRFSPHDLRDFFQSALENANINANFISPLMAHKIKGVDQHYSSHESEELLAKYEIALPYLIPETTEGLKTELNQTKKQYEQKIRAQQKQIDEMPQKIREELEKLFPDIKKLYK